MLQVVLTHPVGQISSKEPVKITRTKVGVPMGTLYPSTNGLEAKSPTIQLVVLALKIGNLVLSRVLMFIIILGEIVVFVVKVNMSTEKISMFTDQWLQLMFVILQKELHLLMQSLRFQMMDLFLV